MSELIPTVHAMAKKELLVDLRLAQPGVSAMPGHYYSVIFDGSTRQDEAIAITVRLVNEQWETIQRLVRIDIVAKFVAGTQLSQVSMESLFTDLASRKASNGHDHRWCSNKQSSSLQPGSPGSVYAADDQMDKGCCVPPKSPLFGHTQHPLAGHNLSFSHMHDQGHLCRPGCLYDV